MGDVHVQKGPLKPATESYKEGIRSGSIAGNNFLISLAEHRLIVMFQRRGKLRNAMQLVEQYLSEENPLKNQSGALNLIYGELLYEMNCLVEASEQIRKSIKICRFQQHAAAIPYCKMQLARIHFAQQNDTGTRKETKESAHLLEQSDIAPWVKGFVNTWKLRYHILYGESDKADELVRQRGLSLDGVFIYPNSSEYLSFARYLAAAGKYQDALQLLQRLLDRLVSIDWLNLAYEAQVVQAMVFQKAGQTDKAIEVVSSVLDFAEPEGYLRLFIDEGQPLAELLELAQKRGIHQDYIDKILFEIKHGTTGKSQSGKLMNSPAAEGLSKREIEVLRLLKTYLPSTEIASELFISVNTARSHIKSIYSKLSVHNREEAVKAAQKQSLI
jgi:LuxR family maltose regulon positive regulatory protein